VRTAKGEKTAARRPEATAPWRHRKGELPGRFLLHSETARLANGFDPCFETDYSVQMPKIYR
jgi:hypothetical protein